MKITVKELLGENFAIEDAILLRDYIEKNINEQIELDFEGLNRVSTSFLCCLFTDLINSFGRDYIFNKINVKNLSNARDYCRVIKGTTFN